MKKVLLAGHNYQEKLFIGNLDSEQIFSFSNCVDEYVLPGGIMLLKNFLQAILPGDEIITLENPENKTVQRISEAKNRVLSKPNSIHISRFIGHSIVSGEEDRNEQKTDLTGADALIINNTCPPFKMADNRIDELALGINSIIIYKPWCAILKNNFLSKLTGSYVGQLIAIVDADDLRELGLQISSQLSWDKTLEDFRREFHSNPIFKNLKKCNTLLIRFGLEATLCIFNTQPGKQQFIFYCIPSTYEGQFKEQMEGDMHGKNEAFEAAFLKKILYPDESRLENEQVTPASIVAATNAAINCLHNGYSKDEKSGTIDYPVIEIFKESGLSSKVTDVTEIMNSEEKVSLLGQLTFHSSDLLHYLAFLFAKEGISSSFDMFPYATYNDITTYDRDEIEGFRGLKTRISNYISGNENKPLSVGVFGPPGSGKSFGVKQIGGFFKNKIVICEFNLSHFRSYDDLVSAFRKVSDINLAGKIPLVFFDEFDCDFEGKPLGWLVNFIAPMQDGVYKSGENTHPLGKGIFVFAGGNFATFEELNSLISDEEYKREFGNNNSYLSSFSFQQIKSGKVEDFIGRIKWHLNIKGIDKKDEKDDLYSLRRAMVLRNILKGYPGIMDASGRINIDNDLLYALMQIPKFGHGARSLEIITRSCGLENRKGFHKAYLPSRDQLRSNVEPDKFEQLMNEQNFFPPELIEPVAKEIHERWLTIEMQKDSAKVTMKSWDELPDDIKDSNRQQAIDMIRKLRAFGYSVIAIDKTTFAIDQFTPDEEEQMARMEHDRWMAEKISKGWIYGKTRNDQLKIHDCLLTWNELDEKTKDLDRNAVKIIPGLMKSVGFGVHPAKS